MPYMVEVKVKGLADRIEPLGIGSMSLYSPLSVRSEAGMVVLSFCDIKWPKVSSLSIV